MDQPLMFGEFFGCMAATSLGLLDEDLKPAITVPGIKTGYRREILRQMRLRMGQGAGGLFYCDASPNFTELFHVLSTPALAMATADVLREYEELGLEPKALFDKLLREPRPVDPSTWAARQLWLAGNSVKATGEYWEDQTHAKAKCKVTLGRLIKRLEAYARARWPATLVLNMRAERLHLGGDLSGWYIVLDPPYEGVTGYEYSCTIDDVLLIARRLHAAGAVVVICEARSLKHLLGAGWYDVDITPCREGQRRRWSKTKHEWLTMNREPLPIIIEEQPQLFR